MVVEKLLELPSWDFEKLKGVDALRVLLLQVTENGNIQKVPLIFEKGKTDFLPEFHVWNVTKKLQ